MKRSGIILSLALSFTLFFATTACGPKEKAAEGPQAGGKTLGAPIKDEAVYVTEKRGDGEVSRLKMDFSALDRPKSLEEFTRLPHLPPIRQFKTGMCWCFGTISLLESELKRLGKPEIKLSEEFTVYWEYVEKARRFIREKGNSVLGEGSEPNSAIARMKQYGVVRGPDYTGLLDGKTEHDHSALFGEFRGFLQARKAEQDWDEEKALAGVRAILDKHLGKPPDRIDVDGKSLTPKEYLDSLGLNLDNYVCFISFKYLPFHTRGEYKVPDNWWHSADYDNVPIDEYEGAVLGALKKGFTVALAADISEPGNSGDNNIGVIPTFDIPRDSIDQSSREFRLTNGASTDDHVVHCVGYKESAPDTWFLVKDSWETAYRGPVKGYFFYRADYLKLKVLMFMTHKDAVVDLLAKFKASN
jgi:bleomycin hydrolase